jgi:undecaprenyl-diphosphatase
VSRRARAVRSPHGVFHNIRSPEIFARHPLVGVAMFIFGTLVFAFIAHNVVTNGPLVAWDNSIARDLHTRELNSPPWVQALMTAGYYVGDQLVAAIGVVLGIYFLRQRCWREFVMVASGFGVSALLFLLLAHTFDRPRPIADPRVEGLPGFPSGHAVAVVASYGLLLYFFIPKMASRAVKVCVIAGVCFVALYVLYSRAFEGGHYPTDLVAGCAVGIAWSGLAHTVVELIFRKRSCVKATRGAALALPK